MDMNIDSRIFKEDLEMINLSHDIDWSKLQFLSEFLNKLGGAFVVHHALL